MSAGFLQFLKGIVNFRKSFDIPALVCRCLPEAGSPVFVGLLSVDPSEDPIAAYTGSELSGVMGLGCWALSTRIWRGAVDPALLLKNLEFQKQSRLRCE